jgi:hypothetical protein
VPSQPKRILTCRTAKPPQRPSLRAPRLELDKRINGARIFALADEVSFVAVTQSFNTTLGFLAPRWTALPCRPFWTESGPAKSISSSSTRSTGWSLADFAKLVELFDAHEVSFVAVTQSPVRPGMAPAFLVSGSTRGPRFHRMQPVRRWGRSTGGNLARVENQGKAQLYSGPRQWPCARIRLRVRREWQKLFGHANSIGMSQTRRNNEFTITRLTKIDAIKIRHRRGNCTTILPRTRTSFVGLLFDFD